MSRRKKSISEMFFFSFETQKIKYDKNTDGNEKIINVSRNEIPFFLLKHKN